MKKSALRGAAIQSELDTQWEGKLAAAISAALSGVDSKIAAAAEASASADEQWIEAVEQRVTRSVEASVMQWVEDKGEQLEALVHGRFEQQKAQPEAVAAQPDWDGEALRQSLKEELMAEWAEASRAAADEEREGGE